MIEIEGLWKQYRLGDTIDLNRSFREALTEKFASPRRSKTSQEEQYFWALRDINLTVPEGRSLGLIGHNGAGKSTLLKVLSRITKPTRGRIKLAGSLSSLLEVGTGFHPELSGRENVFLYGSIMGMTKLEIQNKFDEIVSYAGIEKFIDTPVKRYSSGMYVRLAFSIAAHVEPDILIVDEVLAVGDKSFREKCLGKMDDVAQSGRTVIFVSHNMGAVASLCQDVAWLDGGKVKMIGETKSVIEQYENSHNNSSQNELANNLIKGPLKNKVKVTKISINQDYENFTSYVSASEDLEIDIHWLPMTGFEKLHVTISLFHQDIRIMSLDDLSDNTVAENSKFISKFRIPKESFMSGQLLLAAGAIQPQTGEWCWGESLKRINIVAEDQNSDFNQSNLMCSIGTSTRVF